MWTVAEHETYPRTDSQGRPYYKVMHGARCIVAGMTYSEAGEIARCHNETLQRLQRKPSLWTYLRKWEQWFAHRI